MPRRSGHRGARGYAPENTIAAFEKAIELECDEVETDVWLRDGELVISHDPPRAHPGVTLDDVLATCRGHLTVNVEVKAWRDPAAAQETGSRVAARIAQGDVEAYVSSFWWPALLGARDGAATVRRAYIYASYPEVQALVARAKALGLWALHPAHAYVTKDLVRAAHAAGLQVNAWTANEQEDILALIALGVDGIMSDFPDRIPKL